MDSYTAIDLVGERLDIGRMDGHHRVEQKCQIHPFGFDRRFEGLSVAVEAPGATLGGDVDLRFVVLGRSLLEPPEAVR